MNQTPTTDARAPYVSIHVQLETPDAPMLNGRPVTTVSWNANRFSSGTTSFVVYAHHPEDAATPDDHLTVLLRTNSTAPPTVPDWCPRPPAGWLASLRMTEPDHIAAASAAMDAEWPTGSETVAEWESRVAAIRTGRVF